jgi:hypothetical protein
MMVNIRNRGQFIKEKLKGSKITGMDEENKQ